jgi:ERCC4-type nuclease
MITSAIIDSREPKHIQRLTFGGVPTTVIALDAGDVMATTDDNAILLIERKTPGDLLGTIARKRLFPQCTKILDVTPWAYLVITGILYRDRDGYVTVGGQGHTGWRYADVQGALLTAQEMGVGVLYCAEDEFEAAVLRLCNRDRSTVRIKPPREGYLLKDGEAALAALPGIGPERVQTLISTLGSVSAVLEWLTNLDDQRHVSGVAGGIKQHVKAALGLNGEVLRRVPQDCRNTFYTDGGGLVASCDDQALNDIGELYAKREATAARAQDAQGG